MGTAVWYCKQGCTHVKFSSQYESLCGSLDSGLMNIALNAITNSKNIPTIRGDYARLIYSLMLRAKTI